MRPPVGAEHSVPRSRKPSVADASPCQVAGSGGPTTFFLRREEELESSADESRSLQLDSTYGVQSLADTLRSVASDDHTGTDTGDDEVDPDTSSGKKSRIEKPSSRSLDTSPRMTVPQNMQQSSSASSPGRTSAIRNVTQPGLQMPSQPTLSQPLTPLRLESPIAASTMPGSPKSISIQSFRLSDDDSAAEDNTSQAILSSEDDEEEEKHEKGSRDSSFPELVMPSIQMPRRRPFTVTGKSMGRLKLLIAGGAGVGKSALIKSIVQVCDDIVYVDPLSLNVPNVSIPTASKSSKRKKMVERSQTTKIAEVHASTKAYPSWWSEMEESRVLRRRKSLNDTVLERNICFIDTPGFHNNSTFPEDTDGVIGYMESLFHNNLAVGSMSDSELLSIFSGGGGAHVDVVLYLFSHQNRSKDVEFCQKLASITNVIPLISKADMLSTEEVASLKSSILSSLDSATVRPFLFGRSIDESQLRLSARRASSAEAATPMANVEIMKRLECIPPFAISSKNSLEDDTMDASLLMSPDYVQPLAPSELGALVSEIFSPDNISWLRHTAAKKFIQWRNRNQPGSASMIMHNSVFARSDRLDSSATARPTQDPVTGRTTSPVSVASSLISSPSQVLVPHGSSPFFSVPASSSASVSNEHLTSTLQPSEYTLARIRDHTQEEERFAQVKLAKWASDLQRSLRNERERFEQLERSKRAQWLLERVGEEVRDGRILPALPSNSPSHETEKDWAIVRRNTLSKRGWTSARNSLDPRDPLGLCDLGDGLGRKGILVLRILGGVGVVGAVMIAAVRALGAENQIASWWDWITGGSSNSS